jgi:hypothetical protein
VGNNYSTPSTQNQTKLKGKQPKEKQITKKKQKEEPHDIGFFFDYPLYKNKNRERD